MTLRSGRQFLSIPGPTNVPDEVLQAMHRPAVDIYGGEHGGELFGITMSSLAGLKKIFKTDGETYIYIANGHGAWEAALSNVLSAGDTILVLESGRFAVGWGEMGRSMGLNIESIPNGWTTAVDPAKVEEHLRGDTEGKIKAVLMVQVDTASGCVNDIQAVRAAMNATGHDALLMVDTIASLACMPFEMDAWGIDVAVGGSQKGLMMPPGLSYVAANDKAKAAHANAGLRTSYWDWATRDEEEHYRKYCGTPPVHMLFAMRQAFDMIFEEGLDAVIERHRILAGAVHAAVDQWSKDGVFDYNITNPSERAPSVTVIRTAEGIDPGKIRTICVEKMGVTLGLGIGDLGGKAFRIGHMGHVNAPMILGTLGALEVGLDALGYLDDNSRGGISAATAYLASALKAA
ncbi:aminotransferase class V-fold PLP-dependent enzyme [Rhodospirillales bacterium]|nr:aminotransferase class V-fold PLP-dependent enzyme [Rhodospirillales bacterium]